MKRDMDLIKAILLKAEDDDFSIQIEKYTEQEVLYHQKLLIDVGYLNGKVYNNTETAKKEIAGITGREITWQGYDFLEVLKDDKKFEYIKDIAKKMPLEVMKMGIKLAFEKLKEG
jgi:hypothetical protein